ncbi:MAG: AAA family ATPase [Deltaproteobacteria bacterium]|nr:AAA family ATPase [Deltaproteobacteria bacterium]
MAGELLCYGAKLDSARLRAALNHTFQSNLKAQEKGRSGTPVCIWGTHGLGKTMVVQDYAREHNWRFAYCAPAQFEEMGDLHGLPMLVDPDSTVQGDEYTVFAPPSWVPKDDGPGILLLDDINRADDRILRGLMQLLQNFEMFSWSLPRRWQIVATANPEGGDYSVTPMDDAMLTRMLHFTLAFDARSWAAWATRLGVDPRGISFVLTYPEVVTGKRTTPRSLTQFFDQLRELPDLKAEAELVHVLAQSTLDDVTAATFMNFVNDNLAELINPEEVLDAEDFKPVSRRLEKLAGPSGGAKRVDRLATVCTRLAIHVTASGYKPAERHGENLVSFLLHKDLPNDLRVALHKDLLRDGTEAVKEMLRDKRLAELMLAGM